MRDLEAHLVPTPCHGHGHLALHQVVEEWGLGDAGSLMASRKCRRRSRNVLFKKEDAERASLLVGKRGTVHMNARKSALRGPSLSVKL